MKRAWKIIGLLIVVFLLAVSIHVLRASGQAGAVTGPSAASKGQRSLAVGIVRLINTAEVIDCRTKDGKIDEGEKFLPWDELLNAPCFKEAQTRVRFTNFNTPSLSSGAEIVPGLELRLVVSSDGKHYNLWLGQKDDMCGFAFYSDERGAIYEGKVIGCDAPAVIEPATRVRPVYPPAAKQAGIEGNVRLRVTINKDGSVMDIEVLSGHPLLVKAALEAVQRWRYSPNQLVRITIVTVNFSLDKAGASTPPAQVTAGHTLVSELPSGAHPQSAPQAQATTGASLPSFEVGSIRLHLSGNHGTTLTLPTGGTMRLSNGGTKGLIEMAYNVQAFQVSGGPSWINSESYDIEAKIRDSVADKMPMLTFEERRQQMRLMIQSLLADRFKLRVSLTTSEQPIYALVIAKNGPKLHEADPGDTYINGTKGPDGIGPKVMMSAGINHITYQDVSMAVVAEQLSRRLGRTVLDQTGLKGKYDFTLQWTHDQNQKATNNLSPGEACDPSIFTAIQEQLGLELKSTKAPVEILVIDHIERPSAN
jgi:uncharacterized protein (TIGR03435 family)